MDDIRRRSRKFKMLKFNVQVPAWVFAKGMALLPDDAMILNCDYDHATASNIMLVWSSHFEVAHESKSVPEIILEGNSDTKEVAIAEVLEDGSWNYWTERAEAGEASATNA